MAKHNLVVHYIMAHKTIGFQRLGDLFIFVTKPTLHNDDWSEWIETGAAFFEKSGYAPVAVTLSPSSGPSAEQRRTFAQKSQYFRTDLTRRQALLTNSTFLRGAITAMAWLTKSSTATRAFRLGDVPPALQWLAEIGQFDQTEAARCIATLQRVMAD